MRYADRDNLFGKYSSGHRGDGALLGLDYRIDDHHQICGTFTPSADRTDPYEGTVFAIGNRSRVTNQVTVFAERQFAERGDESGLMHVFGLDFAPAPGVTAGLSYQRGHLATRDGLIDRDSARFDRLSR